MQSRQFRELLAAFSLWGFDTRGWMPRTRNLYGYHVTCFEDWITTERDRPARRASHNDVLSFLSTRPPTPETRNSICSALHGFFQFLTQTARRNDNPMTGIVRFRKTNAVPKALEAATANLILGAAHAIGPFHHAMLCVFLYSGARNAELRSLEWTSIEGDAWLRIHGKGNKTRIVPLHREVRGALKKWKEVAPPSQFLFPSPVLLGRSISASLVNKQVAKIGERTGVVGLHPHVCRHTFATRLIEQGVDIRTVQELLGHSSVAETQKYTRVRPVGLQAAMETLSF